MKFTFLLLMSLFTETSHHLRGVFLTFIHKAAHDIQVYTHTTQQRRHPTWNLVNLDAPSAWRWNRVHIRLEAPAFHYLTVKLLRHMPSFRFRGSREKSKRLEWECLWDQDEIQVWMLPTPTVSDQRSCLRRGGISMIGMRTFNIGNTQHVTKVRI